MSFLVFVSRKHPVRNERTTLCSRLYFNFTGKKR
nr:MAG TPA: hypothetical protein [Microviridae sp.]